MNGGRSKIGPSSTSFPGDTPVPPGVSPTWLADNVCITYWASNPAVIQRTGPVRSWRGASATQTGRPRAPPPMGRALAGRALREGEGGERHPTERPRNHQAGGPGGEGGARPV